MTQAQLGRLLIRDIHPWEGAKMFALTGDRDVMRYMGFKVHDTVEQATALIALYQQSPSKFQAVCLDGDPSDILGIVGLEVRGHQAAMTIMFRRDWKARGIGREFSVPFVKWIFTHDKIWRVWAYVHVDNMPVQRVLERMGARQEGLLRRFEFFPNVSAEPQDVFIYAIVRD
jgi:[ribosomal protein S5]-alanine N-acetyltransferase